MSNLQKITIKQRKFLIVYLETGNATEAAMQAYSPKTRNAAGVMGNEILRKLKDGAIEERMDAAGLSDEYLMRIMHEGLTAEKVEIAKHQGTLGEEKAFADYVTRARFAELVLKWKGAMTTKIDLNATLPTIPGATDVK